MKILAISTVTETCSASLMIDDVIINRFVCSPRKHADYIIPIINDLFIESSIKLQDLDCIALCHGPGSFVGIRIGICVAQSLALTHNLPVITVSSLMVLAQGAFKINSSKQICVAIDACMGKIYWAQYILQLNKYWVTKYGELFVSVNDFHNIHIQTSGDWILVGTGWQIYSKLICINKLQVTLKKIMHPSASDIIPLALHHWNNGNVLTAFEVKPIYLHDDIIFAETN